MSSHATESKSSLNDDLELLGLGSRSRRIKRKLFNEQCSWIELFARIPKKLILSEKVLAKNRAALRPDLIMLIIRQLNAIWIDLNSLEISRW